MTEPTLADTGENALLEQLLPGLPGNDSLLLGPGDDCALVARDEHWDGLLKTDAVVEGIHFERGTAPERIGHKALARAMSDIAAMGGLAEHALVTLFVHPSRPLPLLKGIYSGLSALARRYGVSLAGGETTSLPHDGLALSIALTGRVEKGRAILRSGGRPGDILCVSGQLGGSFPSGRHLDFEPRLLLARALMEQHCAPRAMMDLSDGLACDLPRLARASGCHYRLEHAALPLHKGCSTRQALEDGEDYELLMAFAPEDARRLATLTLPCRLTPIGALCAEAGTELSGGWQHFVSHATND